MRAQKRRRRTEMMSKPEVIKAFMFHSYLRPDLYANIGRFISLWLKFCCQLEQRK